MRWLMGAARRMDVLLDTMCGIVKPVIVGLCPVHGVVMLMGRSIDGDLLRHRQPDHPTPHKHLLGPQLPNHNDKDLLARDQ